MIRPIDRIWYVLIVAVTGLAAAAVAPAWGQDEAELMGVHAQRGVAAFEEGDYGKAIEHFTKQIEVKPLPTLYYYRGVAHEMINQDRKAIADLGECLKLSPKHARAMYSRSLTYRKTKQWNEAFADIKRAAELEPDDFRVVNAYAQLLISSPNKAHHDFPLAIKQAEHACKLTEWEDAICVQTLADAHEAAGNKAKAKSFAEMARKLADESE
jgi:tetratricopeptide (TPR) repeat protein